MNELTLFDYASLPINDAMELNAIKERIKIRLKRTAEDIIEIGKDLIIAKEKCGHGEFMPKIAQLRADISHSKINKYMQIAKGYPELSKTQSTTLLENIDQ